MKLQPILDSTASRFDEKFTKTWSGLPLSQDSFDGLKSFIHSAQLQVIEAVRKEIAGLKKSLSKVEGDNLLADASYNTALCDVLSALDLSKEDAVNHPTREGIEEGKMLIEENKKLIEDSVNSENCGAGSYSPSHSGGKGGLS